MKRVITRAEAAGMSLVELRRKRQELADAIPGRDRLGRMDREELEYAKLSIEVQKMILEFFEEEARRKAGVPRGAVRWWAGPPRWFAVALMGGIAAVLRAVAFRP